jgi:RNA polymerase sigma-54 factor
MQVGIGQALLCAKRPLIIQSHYVGGVEDGLMRLALKTQTRLSPQLVFTSSLLRAASAEVEQLIQCELADNPALTLVPKPQPASASSHPLTLHYAEPHASSTHLPSGDQSDATVEMIEMLVDRPSALDQLAAQVSLLLESPEQPLALQLLHLLDRHGYLRITPQAAAAELNVEPAVVARLIGVLHELEPPGIGAYDLRDCFRIQCAHLAAKGVDCNLVSRIVCEAWDDFIHRRWPRVARQLAVPCNRVEEAWQFVQANLYPYPLSLLDDGSVSTPALASADLMIHRRLHNGRTRYTVEIPAAESYELRISRSFGDHWPQTRDGSSGLAPEEQVWIQTYVDRARLFITGIQQRWATLRQIGQYLVDYQTDFLARGPRYLKPLTRAMVGAALGYHESTVSRAVQDKFAQLPTGRLLALSAFFDNSLAAKAMMQQILARANQPLNDRMLAEQLQAEGIQLARRTVAKYREQLKLPTTHWR